MSAFPATRHSIVAAIRSQRADVRRSAFDALVTAYWKPVFKYVRLKNTRNTRTSTVLIDWS